MDEEANIRSRHHRVNFGKIATSPCWVALGTLTLKRSLHPELQTRCLQLQMRAKVAAASDVKRENRMKQWSRNRERVRKQIPSHWKSKAGQHELLDPHSIHIMCTSQKILKYPSSRRKDKSRVCTASNNHINSCSFMQNLKPQRKQFPQNPSWLPCTSAGNS